MCTNDLPSFKIRQVSRFLILSHGPSVNTITKALMPTLQERKQMEEQTFSIAN
jgi:hypothetical protein